MAIQIFYVSETEMGHLILCAIYCKYKLKSGILTQCETLA